MAKAAKGLNPAAMAAKYGGEDNSDKLDMVRSKVRETRDALLTQKAAQERVAEISKTLNDLYHKQLPDLFMEAGIDSLGLEAEGNLPAFDTKLKPFYKASIPKDKEGEAFSWLEKQGHGDMIKNMFSVQFGMGDNTKAKKLEAFLKKEKISYECGRGVPWNTLTAFVKEQIEDRKVKPSDLPLDLLGAYVGRIVTIKPRKKD